MDLWMYFLIIPGRHYFPFLSVWYKNQLADSWNLANLLDWEESLINVSFTLPLLCHADIHCDGLHNSNKCLLIDCHIVWKLMDWRNNRKKVFFKIKYNPVLFCWSSRSRPWRVFWALCGICQLTASTTRWRSVRWTELWASWSAHWRTDVRPTRSPSSRAAEGSFETCRVWSPHEKTTGRFMRLKRWMSHDYLDIVNSLTKNSNSRATGYCFFPGAFKRI